jgi:hypothetical protein
MTFFRPAGVRDFYDTLDVLALFSNGKLLSTHAGGLVVGRRHAEGHVPMFHLSRDGNGMVDGIRCMGVMEGGEFLVNHVAYHARKPRFNAINDAGTRDRAERPEIGEDVRERVELNRRVRVFNAHDEPHDRLLLIDQRHQFVVNRRGVLLHLEELFELNEAHRD